MTTENTSPAQPHDVITEAQRYMSAKRDELLQQISTIETFLGFAQQSDDLAVRIAKIEAFIGLKG